MITRNKELLNEYYAEITKDGEMTRTVISPSVLTVLRSLTLMDLVDMPTVSMSAGKLLGQLDSVYGIKTAMQEAKQGSGFENRLLVVLLYAYYIAKYQASVTGLNSDDILRFRLLMSGLASTEETRTSLESAI